MTKFILIALFAAGGQVCPQGRNIFYFDFGIILAYEANAGIGLNYERMLNNHIRFRTCLNTAFDIDKGPQRFMILGLPAGFNSFTGWNNKFKIGIGSGVNVWIDRSHAGKIQPGALLRIGSRHQKKNEEGRFFKAGMVSKIFLLAFKYAFSEKF